MLSISYAKNRETSRILVVYHTLIEYNMIKQNKQMRIISSYEKNHTSWIYKRACSTVAKTDGLIPVKICRLLWNPCTDDPEMGTGCWKPSGICCCNDGAADR